jgi:superfamily II DNA/RNA helicase
MIYFYFYLSLLEFERYLQSPAGEHINRIFFDEAHEFYSPHPDRLDTFAGLATAFQNRPLQRIFLSGTQPPAMAKAYHKKALLSGGHIAIRAQTDRPELGFHVLSLKQSSQKDALFYALIRLVTGLIHRLEEKDRIIVFFQSVNELERYAKFSDCPKYHSKLPMQGDTKDFNLRRWDDGDHPVLAATTAVANGTDRPFVKYVVVYEGTFGLVTLMQEFGRAGRAGEYSQCIYLRSANSTLTTVKSRSDTSLRAHVNHFVASRFCRRHFLTLVMDGEKFGRTCKEIGSCNHCDNCQPDGEFNLFLKETLIAPTDAQLNRSKRPRSDSINPSVAPPPEKRRISESHWSVHGPNLQLRTSTESGPENRNLQIGGSNGLASDSGASHLVKWFNPHWKNPFSKEASEWHYSAFYKALKLNSKRLAAVSNEEQPTLELDEARNSKPKHPASTSLKLNPWPTADGFVIKLKPKPQAFSSLKLNPWPTADGFVIKSNLKPPAPSSVAQDSRPKAGTLHENSNPASQASTQYSGIEITEEMSSALETMEQEAFSTAVVGGLKSNSKGKMRQVDDDVRFISFIFSAEND